MNANVILERSDMWPPRELFRGPQVEESGDSIYPGGRQRRNSQLTLRRPAQLRELADSICAIGSEIHPFRAGHGRRTVGLGFRGRRPGTGGFNICSNGSVATSDLVG